MEDNLIQILESFKYPVYRQGSMSGDDSYPETFFTFRNTESPDHAHYDNTDYGTSWFFSVYVYSSDPSLTYSLILDARAALKAAGWIVPSKGYDVDSDEATHTGRGIDIQYLETK